jgi:MFS family permease
MNDQNPPNNSGEKIAYEPPDDERPTTGAPNEAQLEKEVPTVKALDYSPAPAPHDPYAAWRLPVFRHFIFSFLLATLGTQIMSVALQWQLAKQTHNPAVLGLLGGMQALPVILLALPAGHVSDTFGRKGVLMFTQVILVICPALLAALTHFAGHSPHYISLTFAIVLANAVALTFARPARQAFLPQLVSNEVFSNAITWNATTFELASITGPAIGGLIIWRSSPTAALICSAACTLVCLGLTALLPSKPAAGKNEPFGFATLIAGVKFVFNHNFLLPALTLDLFAVLFGGATYLLPFFAERLFADKPEWQSIGFGLLRAAPSVGAVLMAIVIAHLPPMKRAGRALLLAVIGFGMATIVFGLSTNFWLSLAMLFLTGAFDNVSVVVRHTLVQLMTPDSMRGRVSAVNQVFIGSSNELGGMESGFTAKWFGLVPSVVFGGVGTIVVVILIAIRWPNLRKIGSLQGAGEQTQ